MQELNVQALQDKVKELIEDNVKLAHENKELESLKMSLIKTAVTQTDKVMALESRVNELNAQIRLLIAIIREDGTNEQETEKASRKTE